MRRKRWILGAAALVLLGGLWFLLNPPGRFGKVSFFGLVTYNSVPHPGGDFEVSASGERRSVPKSHRITRQDLAWMLESRPDVVVIAKGWQGAVTVDQEVADGPGISVVVLETGDALEAYNLYKRAGRRVAIHIHSTC